MNHHDINLTAAQVDKLGKAYDPLDHDVKQDPYPYYAKLRRDEPVKWIEGLQAFAVSRYDDVDIVLKDASIFSSAQFWPALLGEFDPVPEVPPMISMDPPNHMQLRKLVNRAFLPTQVNALQQRSADIANQLIDDLVAKYGAEGKCDWVWDFTSLYPVTVISEVLGVPSERRAEFKVWVDDVLGAANRAAYGPERLAEIRKSSDAVRAFFEELYDQRSANPGSDMISTLIQAEVDGTRLTRIEVIQMAILLLIGGVETTTNLLGSALVEFSRRPEVYARVRNDPALIPAFIEELLRFNPTVQMIFRHTTRDTELSGVHMPKGSAVMVLLASANRDETRFDDSESFDLDRKPSAPLMSFGQGPHFCLGKYLSLMETRSALETAFKRFETLASVSEEVEWIDSYFARGPHKLPVHYKVR
ncbi:cytochrome P450 [Noviherbaspirillum sedimenti]|uniref:Cytochrome P450 n=1 Tax=Noviherbaspirillum sedimenti TaxID=2320865 RepID=A0A3A3G5R8_9BURK|nr:cytochrome P450 [Noviherbaspirillum sedimenti]RJG01852.1 cytochrome P450 [Noviherbaspirillum sedimenti]